MSISFLFLLVSCQQEKRNGFHIQGTIDGAENGTVVMLQANNEQSPLLLAQTEVQQNQFTFSGVQDSTIECCITYMQNGRKMGADFFLENGRIDMNFSNETSQITGTANNNRLQQFLNKINAIYKQIGSTYNDHPESDLIKEEQEDSIPSIVEDLNQQADALIGQTILEHIDNPVGYHLFCRFNQNLTANQQETILKKLPAHWRHTPAIEDIRSQLLILPPDSIQEDTVYLE